jgi:ribonuclease Z
MKVLILGNAAGGPFHGRHYTAQLLQAGNHYFLLDCGEGTQMQIFHHRAKADRCNHIFISHLHGDHVFGLMGLITNWCLKKRTEPLRIFSPPGLQELLETTIRICGVRLCYSIEFQEVDAFQSLKVFENKEVEVWSIPLNHRTPTSGWLFREKPKPLNIRPEALQQYGITEDFTSIKAIKAGADLVLADGSRVPNEHLTLPPAPLRAYAFCSDTAPSDVVVDAVKEVDLLYHEATFTNEHLEEAIISFHSTARQAAGIALQANVGKLIIGHLSGRYADESQHLLEAREVFENTELAAEGVCFEV